MNTCADIFAGIEYTDYVKFIEYYDMNIFINDHMYDNLLYNNMHKLLNLSDKNNYNALPWMLFQDNMFKLQNDRLLYTNSYDALKFLNYSVHNYKFEYIICDMDNTDINKFNNACKIKDVDKKYNIIIYNWSELDVKKYANSYGFKQFSRLFVHVYELLNKLNNSGSLYFNYISSFKFDDFTEFIRMLLIVFDDVIIDFYDDNLQYYISCTSFKKTAWDDIILSSKPELIIPDDNNNNNNFCFYKNATCIIDPTIRTLIINKDPKTTNKNSDTPNKNSDTSNKNSKTTNKDSKTTNKDSKTTNKKSKKNKIDESKLANNIDELCKVNNICNQIYNRYCEWHTYVHLQMYKYMPLTDESINIMVDKIMYTAVMKYIKMLDDNSINYKKYFLSAANDYHKTIYNYYYTLMGTIVLYVVNYATNEHNELDKHNEHNERNILSRIKKGKPYIYELFNNSMYKTFSIKQLRQTEEEYDRKHLDYIPELNMVEDFARNLARYIKNKHHIDSCSNGFVKLWEIYNRFDIFDNKSTNIKTFHMCEAPGQWIRATKYYIEKNYGETMHEWRANSLNPNSEINISKFSNIFGDTYGMLRDNPDKWIFGADDTGDITTVRNIKWYTMYMKEFKPDVITGDAGLNVAESTLYMLHKLDFAQYVMAVTSGATACVIKTFGPFMGMNDDTKISSGYFTNLLYLYILSYDKVYLYKPYTSSQQSTEFYIIGKGYKKIDDISINKLHEMLDTFEENQTFFEKDEIPDYIIDQIASFHDGLVQNFVIGLEKEYFFTTCFKDNDEKLKTLNKCKVFMENNNMKHIQEKKFKTWMTLFNFKHG
jgi:23S rRNA U2552 (ribose-2'-O)-methylase RlmE/FtsJ